MPIERITRGGPLSEAYEARATAPLTTAELDEVRALGEAAAQSNTIDGRFAPFEAWARATLEAAGLPAAPRDPRWFYELHELKPYENAEWFAHQILLCGDNIRGHLAEGRAELAVCEAVQLGRLTWVVEIKHWEPDTTRGRKVAAGSALGGSAKATQEQARALGQRKDWQEAADRIWTNNPLLSKSAVARRIDSKRAHTIRRWIVKP